jgi:hypothetical protein
VKIAGGLSTIEKLTSGLPVYQDLSEAAQSRLTSLHNLMTRSLIGL